MTKPVAEMPLTIIVYPDEIFENCQYSVGMRSVTAAGLVEGDVIEFYMNDFYGRDISDEQREAHKLYVEAQPTVKDWTRFQLFTRLGGLLELIKEEKELEEVR